jgi:hypothetical protein
VLSGRLHISPGDAFEGAVSRKVPSLAVVVINGALTLSRVMIPCHWIGWPIQWPGILRPEVDEFPFGGHLSRGTVGCTVAAGPGY